MAIYRTLLPLSWLYGAGVWLRNRMFDTGILPSRTFPIPIIGVGNLTVGGTGKTPHTEYLIRLLTEEFNVAVLSRGYKRKSKGFVMVTPDVSMSKAGDEPFQMAHKFPEVYVAVDANRCAGIERLTTDRTPDVEVILLDDAYQHRYVKPGLTLLLTDYHRPFYDDALLPAGRLREPASEKRRADMIIVTKCLDQLDTEEQERIKRRIAPDKGQQLYFTRMAYGKLQPLFTNADEREVSSIQPDEAVLLMTGIASPTPLMEKLSNYTSQLHSIAFPDHHTFNSNDMERVAITFRTLAGKKLIITTEKDAARLIANPIVPEALKSYIYVLPIQVEFLNKEELSFNQKIIDYVRENSRNSGLSEK